MKVGDTVRVTTMAQSTAVGKITKIEGYRASVRLERWQADGSDLNLGVGLDELRVVEDTNQVVSDLLDQIARDRMTLKMHPSFIHPNRLFYEERIAKYTEDIRRLRNANLR